MSNFTADFRRLNRGRAFSRDEIALVEALERQRHRTGRVRAVIDSTPGKFTAVLHAYIAYIQRLSGRDAIVVHCETGLRPDYRAVSATPRSYIRILATRSLIGQILLLDAESYCPSLPLYRSRLDAILQIALPYLCGPNSVIIIQGTSRTQKNTRFRHWLKIASNPESIYYLPPRKADLPKVKKYAPLIVEWRPSHGRIPVLQKIPNSKFPIPHSLKIAA